MNFDTGEIKIVSIETLLEEVEEDNRRYKPIHGNDVCGRPRLFQEELFLMPACLGRDAFRPAEDRLVLFCMCWDAIPGCESKSGTRASETALAQGAAILKLPNELLVHIRELLSQTDHAKLSPSEAFQLVCRRFREVELGIPALWTSIRVNDRSSSERVANLLERADNREVELEVVVRRIRGPCWECWESQLICTCACQCRTLAAIADNPHRWFSMRLVLWEGTNAGPDVSHRYPRWHSCLPRFEGIVLHALRSLDIEVSQLCDLRTFPTWRMPNLRRLRWRLPNEQVSILHLPISIDATEHFPLLEDVMLISNGVRGDFAYILRLLASKSFESVKSLRLTITEFILDVPVPDASEAAITQIRLPHLKVLEVDTLGDSEDAYMSKPVFAKILRKLFAPALTTLSVRCAGRDICEPDFLLWIIGMRCPTLTDVEVRLTCRHLQGVAFRVRRIMWEAVFEVEGFEEDVSESALLPVNVYTTLRGTVPGIYLRCFHADGGRIESTFV